MKNISTPNAPAAIGPYSQAISCGELVFLSGQIPLVPATGTVVEGGIEAQARQMFQNIGAILAAAGLGFENVVKTTVFLANMDDFAALNAIYGTFFREPYPARSCVEVSRLPRGVLCECECVAAKK